VATRCSTPSCRDWPGLLDDVATLEVRSRSVVERFTLALQAALLVRAGNPIVADAFVRSRLGGEHGQALGTLPVGTSFRALIDRAFSG